MFLLATKAENREPPEKYLVSAAQDIMKDAKYCFFITVDGGGQPRACMVGALDESPEMNLWLLSLDAGRKLWIATSPVTRKVQEIRNTGKATMAYYDGKGGYVAMLGEARIVQDGPILRRVWREDLRTFFPEGPDGSGYLLIEFLPSRVEIMSFLSGVATSPFNWRPAVLLREGSRWTVEK